MGFLGRQGFLGNRGQGRGDPWPSRPTLQQIIARGRPMRDVWPTSQASALPERVLAAESRERRWRSARVRYADEWMTSECVVTQADARGRRKHRVARFRRGLLGSLGHHRYLPSDALPRRLLQISHHVQASQNPLRFVDICLAALVVLQSDLELTFAAIGIASERRDPSRISDPA